MTARTPVHVLVADDDPVSLHFFASVLRQFGCHVVTATNGNATLAACAQAAFDLLLLDRRMPGMGGAPLLRELRRLGSTAPAIATSAELDVAAREELHRAGFREALTKPIGIDELGAVLARHVDGWLVPARIGLTRAAGDPHLMPALLEDEAALATIGGDRATLQALRGLFVTELAALVQQLTASNPPMAVEVLRESLHRLKAACRYCGAVAVGAKAVALDAQLAAAGNTIQVDFLPFLDVCARTCALLSTRS